MNAKLSTILLLLCTFVMLSYFSWAANPAPPNEVPGETMARMQKLGEELATPNEHHTFLGKFAGSWSTKTSMMDLPVEMGSATHEMILGDRFLEGSYEGTLVGIAFEGRMLLGYDNYKHKYAVTYVDNLGTSMQMGEGLLNQAGNILSLWGTMDEWMTDEHDKPVMYRYQLIDNDHFVFEVHDLAIVDGDTLVIEVQYERMQSP